MSQLYYPLDTELVSEWPGPRDGGEWWHYGTDFAVPVDTPLHAAFDGVVVFAGGDGAFGQINGVWANGEGLTVDIQRADGLVARYGHLNRIDVRHGQRVTAGQVIGLSGNTGFTTGPHCHWELRWDRAWSAGAWADPRKLGARPIGEIIMTPAQERKLDRLIKLLEANPRLTAREVMQYKVTRHPVADKLGTTTLAGFLAKGETLARRNITRFDQLIKKLGIKG